MTFCGETKTPDGWFCVLDVGHVGPCDTERLAPRWRIFADWTGHWWPVLHGEPDDTDRMPVPGVKYLRIWRWLFWNVQWHLNQGKPVLKPRRVLHRRRIGDRRRVDD